MLTAEDRTLLSLVCGYLGQALHRAYQTDQQRETALDHYRAALSTGGILPEVKAAAERGIRQPYEPPANRQ